MPRRTVSLPRATTDRVERLRAPDESFSATVARLLDVGADATEGRGIPDYVGIAKGGPPLSADEEDILAEIFAKADPSD